MSALIVDDNLGSEIERQWCLAPSRDLAVQLARSESYPLPAMTARVNEGIIVSHAPAPERVTEGS